MTAQTDGWHAENQVIANIQQPSARHSPRYAILSSHLEIEGNGDVARVPDLKAVVDRDAGACAWSQISMAKALQSTSKPGSEHAGHSTASQAAPGQWVGGSSGAAGTCQVDRAADVNGVIDEPLQGCLHIGLHGIAW